MLPETARIEVMADPIYPVDLGPFPTFMGWTRHDWADAPDPLVEHFGMVVAVWRRDIDEMLVSCNWAPDYDRGELYAIWKAESDAKTAKEVERNRQLQEEQQGRRGRRRGNV